MQRAAHTVKPGDTINGVEVFDLLRATFGGYYIPMIDGSRVVVRTPYCLVVCD
jgi:hypothetical protein